MHKNSIVKIKSIIDIIETHQLYVTREHIIALYFMEPKQFTKVERQINAQTRPIIKATFNQAFIDRNIVLDDNTLAKVQELENSGDLEKEIQEDDLPWVSDSSLGIETTRVQRKYNVTQQIKPYRRDRKDHSEVRSMVAMSPKASPPERTTEPSRNTQQSNISTKFETLSEVQFEQFLNTASLTSIRKILKNEFVILTSIQQHQLKLKLTESLEKKDTIKIKESKVKVRNNQAHFREIVLSAYKEKCAITGINIKPILEAAHVVPANGNNDTIENSILLSKNMHGLFDRFLISINPDTNRLELSACLKGKGLDRLQGSLIHHKASKANLQWHYGNFKG
ncbi:HNH endonuclease [Vibrio sp. CyArs1]|uniref:HNH endonuclease n=1 Tax=Vibrio sp. CyArs1 TaxID=2682577 RepID=UPI001F063F0E|nr:HNH endonuclease [Vibrio sp. CyArs1]